MASAFCALSTIIYGCQEEVYLHKHQPEIATTGYTTVTPRTRAVPTIQLTHLKLCTMMVSLMPPPTNQDLRQLTGKTDVHPGVLQKAYLWVRCEHVHVTIIT